MPDFTGWDLSIIMAWTLPFFWKGGILIQLSPQAAGMLFETVLLLAEKASHLCRPRRITVRIGSGQTKVRLRVLRV